MLLRDFQTPDGLVMPSFLQPSSARAPDAPPDPFSSEPVPRKPAVPASAITPSTEKPVQNSTAPSKTEIQALPPDLSLLVHSDDTALTALLLALTRSEHKSLRLLAAALLLADYL